LKQPSKLDQLRALREAQAAKIEVVRDRPMPGVVPHRGRGAKSLPPSQAAPIAPKPRRRPPQLAVPLLAPPGVCASCDRRRADVAAAVRLHRAKARKITGKITENEGDRAIRRRR
jgi:hypothetical protein